MARRLLLLTSLVSCLGAGAAAWLIAHRAPAPMPPSATLAPTASGSGVVVEPAPVALTRRTPVAREGQSLVRGVDEAALYLADEDHRLLRRVALTSELRTIADGAVAVRAPKTIVEDNPRPSLEPVSVAATESSLALPGAPAQVVSLGDRLLVTVRDPGLLLVVSAGAPMREIGRVALPPDAWGLAVSADGQTAYVTSAWSRQLSRVDVSGDAPKLVWSTPVEREPRGVTVTPDGRRVFVSHLVRSETITSVDVTGEPRVERVFVPPDPLSTFAGEKLGATLGYTATLSPDGRRLFVGRHAMGSFWAWQGKTSVDVVATATGQPLAPVRGGRPFGQLTSGVLGEMNWLADRSGTRAEGDSTSWQQPRAMVYRRKTNHLLVASEGMATLVELDAMSLAPGMITNRVYRLGGVVTERLPRMKFPPRCGAPTGVALSADEDIAYVHCRTTDNLVAVRLTPDGERAHRGEISYLEGGEFHDRLSQWGPFAFASLAVPAADPELALGRRLFFDANDEVVSGQMACAGCHPDGRDDGHVWRERKGHGPGASNEFLAGPSLSQDAVSDGPQDYGMARQTPMLAGRVAAAGPYGWHGESATPVDRLRLGFVLHQTRWFTQTDGVTKRMRAEPLVRYLREGLVPPPHETRALTAVEEQGRQVFLSDRTRCATCHKPNDGEYTDRSVVPMVGYRTLPLFTEDPDIAFKTPSLRFIGGTEPYFHDGSACSLDDLIDHNGDRMGKTSHLSAPERASLVAFLRTL